MRSELRLVLPRPEYALEWYRWRQEPQGRRDNPYDDASLEQLMMRLAQPPPPLDDPSCPHYRWMVAWREHLVGTVSLHSLNRRMGTAEVGYLIGDDYKGRGFATGALALLVEVAFEERVFRRLMALIAADNVASQRVVEKVGFRREGVLREHFVIEGRAVDEVCYGLLREEWDGPHRGS